MPSATISNVGFTAQFAPVIKRATGTLSDGSVGMIVPDTNLAAITGADDVTGVAKLRIYKSDTTRTTWSLNSTTTLSPVMASATVAAVMSMVLDSSNNMHLVYQGTDNSLNYRFFTFSAGAWGLTTSQTVVAANAVTNRYRAVDIDVPNAGSTANVAIIVYESKASAGPSAFTRVYIRNNDGTTWRKAYEEDHASLSGGSLQILPNSEDVSISYNNTGIVSNVGQLLVFWTRSAVANDRGDVVREISYNVSTGTDGSATVIGTWPVFNQNTAAGSRRGWIFKISNNLWQVAMVAGQSWPSFMSMRLTHNIFTAPAIDRSTTTPSNVAGMLVPLVPQIDSTANKYNFIACTYNDNRVMFGFVTSNVIGISGTSTGFTAAAVVFRYNDASTLVASFSDTQMRPLDNYFAYGTQPLGVYGSGNNRNNAGDFKFNFLVLYGTPGNGTNLNKIRAVIDTFYDAPVIIGPSSVVANDTPVLQARVQNTALYPNIKGKLEFQLARDSAFSVDLRTIAEPDVNYRYLGSNTNSAPPAVNIALALNGVGSQKLYSGIWYQRCRVVSDLGQNSVYSETFSFNVSHPPTALSAAPSAGSLVLFGLGNVAFSWRYNDTEPTDRQTAYQLQLVRLDTGATVFDTGKVSSSVNSTTQALSATLKDLPLQWRVSLWDTDDVQGPFSNPVPFTISDTPIVSITSPTAGATVASALPTVGWTPTFFGGRTQRAFRVKAFPAGLIDTFTRTVSNGWGTSDNSKAWTVSGTAANFATGGSSATMALSAVNVEQIITSSVVALDGDFTAEFSLPALATGAAVHVVLLARWTDINNHYRFRYIFNTDGSVQVQIEKLVAGVAFTVAGAPTVTGLTYTASTTYKVRCSFVGSALKQKIWLKSAGEPGFWHLEGTDSSIKNFGAVGVRGILAPSNTNTLNYVITFDNMAFVDDLTQPVGDSGWVQSTAATYTFTSNILANNSYYLISVDVQDSAGLLGHNEVGVLTTWTHPALGNIGVVLDPYGATISWTNANVDANFVAWRIYRRYMVPALSDLDEDNTQNVWVLVYETSVNQASYSYKDYMLPNNKSTDYVIVQLADRFGSLIESNITAFTTVTSVSDRYYFIPGVPIGTIASYEASNVTDDSFTDEVESETLHVISRGRQVQVGDDLGVTGTLTIQLRGSGARADREFIQRLASSRTLNVWMKTPFGDVRFVKFLSVSVKILPGTGQTEMSDLSVPYVEVFSDAPITRL
jgi:hypothetical protein